MGPTIDIVIPVLNEEKALPQCVMILSEFLRENLPDNPWKVIIADNGSTDNTRAVSEMLAQRYLGVSYVYIPQRGRGRALRMTWLESNADIVGYMDVDLSTNLSALPKLIQSIEEGCDIAIGSRLVQGAKTSRSFKRELISRIYNFIVQRMFFVSFHDVQCGFKIISRHATKALVPLVRNNNWFFDTELLLIASNLGFRINEVPVEWVEDPDSRVKVVKTAWEDFRGLLRLRLGGMPSLPPGFANMWDDRI
ncbi:glycosyltransferase family 2 protein [SAR202 cluster bacterium AD-804-J14_MRT_500m]|nr:glycosyltransferase family 2 protein [SAR202 cluster bacterium AD-804-J14_MRT_500m]